MKPVRNLDKFKKLVSKEQSGWHEDARKREENEAWLAYSFKIAVRVLSILRSKSMTQKELADKMGVTPQHVNKIVKGQENLSLETITRLEEALGVQLITISTSHMTAMEMEYTSPGASEKMKGVTTQLPEV